MKSQHRARHADLVLQLASDNQRLMDTLTQRPHLLNPYPNIVNRMAARSRKFRRQMDGHEEPNRILRAQRPPANVVPLRLVANGAA